MLEIIVGFTTIVIVLAVLLIISNTLQTSMPDLMFGIAMSLFGTMVVIGASIEIGRLVLSFFNAN